MRLIEAGLGCTVGMGTGVRYSYLDFAIRELQKAVPLIRDTALTFGVPERTWLLFCDSAWEGEWVGIQQGTPPPP